MAAEIDFFAYSGSTYTYLTIMRINELATKAGVSVRWRPFYARAIMIEQNNVPFRNKPTKARYMWRDLERRAARHGIEWKGIPRYPVEETVFANRVAVIAAQEGWAPEFLKAIYQAWFLRNQDFGDVDVVSSLLTMLGKDATALIVRANSHEAQMMLDTETDAARNLGIFGSPTFVCGTEIFWGDDRLEDALDWATSRHEVHAAMKSPGRHG
jgi:2-hydroxychromene-2-carboxylate isomerase